ncbi:MAG: PP2C family protein-serine/threonine phosphatase [Rhabdochlamydiaceae bacterium]|nr:PP2C family protein-serine/threonine phosphatase [Candidatus Amphrikana amoebophyrae]
MSAVSLDGFELGEMKPTRAFVPVAHPALKVAGGGAGRGAEREIGVIVNAAAAMPLVDPFTHKVDRRSDVTSCSCRVNWSIVSGGVFTALGVAFCVVGGAVNFSALASESIIRGSCYALGAVLSLGGGFVVTREACCKKIPVRLVNHPQHPLEDVLISRENLAKSRLKKYHRSLLNRRGVKLRRDDLFTNYFSRTKCSLRLSIRETATPAHAINLDGGRFLLHSNLFRLPKVGVCFTKGKREYFEDTYLVKRFELMVAKAMHSFTLMAVADGHGGALASVYVRENLEATLKECLAVHCAAVMSSKNIYNALTKTCVLLDRRFNKVGGSTLCFCLKVKIKEGGDKGLLFVANVGDSKAIIITKDRVFRLTNAHVPGHMAERKMVEDRGGSIVVSRSLQMRVNGRVAMTRVIGDHAIRDAKNKYCVLSPLPDLSVVDLEKLPPGARLILLSDGCEHISSMTFGRTLAQASDLSLQELVIRSVAASLMSGSEDNITIMAHDL